MQDVQDIRNELESVQEELAATEEILQVAQASLHPACPAEAPCRHGRY
jgi:hypothetical protein